MPCLHMRASQVRDVRTRERAIAEPVIDGTDGHAHHVRFRGIEAFAHAPPAGGIVEECRFGSPADPRPTLILANRSDISVDHQVTAPGATWLDYRLVEHKRMPLAMGGFGQEGAHALAVRAEHLAAEGLAHRQGSRIVLQRDLLATLRRRDLDAVSRRRAVSRNQASYMPAAHTMIDNGLGPRPTVAGAQPASQPPRRRRRVLRDDAVKPCTAATTGTRQKRSVCSAAWPRFR
jgi:hypothetical protein